MLLCDFPQRTQKFAVYGDHAETGTGWFEDDCRDVTVFRQHMAHGVNIAGRQQHNTLGDTGQNA